MAWRIVLLFLTAWTAVSWSGDEPRQAEWTPRSGPEAAFPAWFTARAPDPQAALGKQEFEVLPSGESGDCLVTVCFQEHEGGFLRILWEGNAGGAVILSDNFYEGIGLPNTRNLLLSRALVGGGGGLIFQSGDVEHGLEKIKVEWLQPTGVQVVEGEGKALEVLSETGKGLRAEDLHGEIPLPEEDQWRGNLVTAPILESPARIEEGVAFACDLEAVPERSLLEVEVAGLPLDGALRVWINGEDAGVLTPEVPALQDPGYLRSADGNLAYAGWRKGRLLLKTGLLRAEENQIQFGPVSEEAPLPPLAVKGLNLQLSFYP